MKKILMRSGQYEFIAVLEEEKSPKTCEWLLNKLPWTVDMIHVSWSGEACFARLLDQAWGLPYESVLRIVHPGQIIVYPGGKPDLQMSGIILYTCCITIGECIFITSIICCCQNI